MPKRNFHDYPRAALILALMVLTLPAALFAQKTEEEYRAALMAELWDKDGNKKDINEAAINRIIENMRIRGYALSPIYQMPNSNFRRDEHVMIALAIENNLTEFLLFLLDCGFGEVMYEEGPHGPGRAIYILEELVKRNNVGTMRVLLEKGYKGGLNRYPHENTMPPVLLMAADAGNAEMVKVLIREGAKVNTRYDIDSDFTSNVGWTALTYAAAKGHADVVRVLLDAGIDVHIKSEHGKVEQVFKDEWIPVKSEIGWTALQHAAAQNYGDVVKLLTEAGAIQAVVNTGGVKVFSKPSEAGGEILCSLGKNTIVSILGRGAKEERIQNVTATWYKIRINDGSVGYGFGAFFDVESEGKNFIPVY